MDSRVVDKDYLPLLGCFNAKDACSCSLGLVGNDGDFLSENSVEKSGLPDVWTSDQGHVADFHFVLSFMRSRKKISFYEIATLHSQ